MKRSQKKMILWLIFYNKHVKQMLTGFINSKINI